jgi:hypothetical protein
MPIILAPAWGYSSTRAQWRALVRAELGDQGATPLWADALLNEWLNEAIRDFARQVPREASLSLTTVAAQADYALPNGLIEVVRVEHPADVMRTFAPLVGGDRRTSGTDRVDRVASPYTYDVWGGALILDPAPTANGESVLVRYTQQRAEPAADTDPLPVEQPDTDLLLLHVCARAMTLISTQEGKRQAFERDRGQTAAAQAAAYQQRHAAGIATRQRTQRPALRHVVFRD